MPVEDLNDAFNRVVALIGNRLKPLGYTRRGLCLRTMAYGNCGVVGFPHSIENHKGRILFTADIGVVCGDILKREGRPRQLSKVGCGDAHLRWRIRDFLPSGREGLWEITNATNVDSLGRDVAGLIAEHVDPAIRPYLDTRCIIALWESGKSPGIADSRRIELLGKLRVTRMQLRLVGDWTLDPSDTHARQALGDALLSFTANGELTHRVRGNAKHEILKLVYAISGNTITTDRPGAPRMERTGFSLTESGALTLALGGVSCRFLRVEAAPGVPGGFQGRI
jgi:hypothetical protein